MQVTGLGQLTRQRTPSPLDDRALRNAAPICIQMFRVFCAQVGIFPGKATWIGSVFIARDAIVARQTPEEQDLWVSKAVATVVAYQEVEHSRILAETERAFFSREDVIGRLWEFDQMLFERDVHWGGDKTNPMFAVLEAYWGLILQNPRGSEIHRAVLIAIGKLIGEGESKLGYHAHGMMRSPSFVAVKTFFETIDQVFDKRYADIEIPFSPARCSDAPVLQGYIWFYYTTLGTPVFRRGMKKLLQGAFNRTDDADLRGRIAKQLEWEGEESPLERVVVDQLRVTFDEWSRQESPHVYVACRVMQMFDSVAQIPLPENEEFEGVAGITKSPSPEDIEQLPP